MLDRVSGDIERYMDLLSARQKLVASNIANADTPGYQTQDFDFQSEFRAAMGGAPRATSVRGLAVKNDGNNVDLDREARLLVRQFGDRDLLRICRRVACSDLLVEPLKRATHRRGGHRSEQFQGLLIHFIGVESCG